MPLYQFLTYKNFNQIQQQSKGKMRKKLQQFRRKIREQHISSYKESIRKNLLRAIVCDEKIDELHRQMISCLEEQNINRLFNTFDAADDFTIKRQDLKTVFEVYRLLVGNIQKFQSSQVLKDLIEIHTTALLSQKSLRDAHLIAFEKMHIITNQFIFNSNDSNQVRVIHLENNLAILNCFYSLHYHKLMQRVIEKKFEQFCLDIIPWKNQLINNISYLRLLSNIFSHPILTKIWSSQPIDERLILKLSENLEQENELLAYWSLTALNDCLQNWNQISEDCLKIIMPRYLQFMSIICPNLQSIQKSPTVEYKTQILQDTLINLQKLVRRIVEMAYKDIGLGSLLLKFQTYRLFSYMNQIQYFPDRCVLYGLLDYTIYVVTDLQNDDQAINRIARAVQGTLILGLGNKFNNHITLNALHAINRLVRYQSCQYNPNLTIQTFKKGGIQLILQYLQFNKHQQVSAIASQLLQRVFGTENLEETV